MAETIPQGRELIEIIQAHDWLLHDTTQSSEEDRAFTWEELQEQSPADQLEMGHNYLFVPKPRDSQTLRDAYAITKGLGPSLTVVDVDDPRWKALDICPKRIPGHVAFFSRLFLEDKFVVASSPPTAYLPHPDVVIMPYETVVDTFRKHFRIVQPGEIGAKTPIPMPEITLN